MDTPAPQHQRVVLVKYFVQNREEMLKKYKNIVESTGSPSSRRVVGQRNPFVGKLHIKNVEITESSGQVRQIEIWGLFA